MFEGTSMQIIGDIALLKFSKPFTRQEKKAIAAQLQKLTPTLKTICELRGIDGEYRVPVLTRLIGTDTTTIHTEHGIKYKIDVAKVMFSKGNINERQRLVTMIGEREKILDMFAGIGYFLLPIAKHNPACEITACEKNSEAFDYLEQNIELNNAANITAIRKDCRRLRFNREFDRIIMGYFPGTEKFLKHALKMIKPGGTVHYHNVYKEHELWSKPHNEIEKACAIAKMQSRILEERKVKSYAPRVYHTVIDFTVS